MNRTNCRQCSKEFVGQRSTAQFCSPACRKKAHRRKSGGRVRPVPARSAYEVPKKRPALDGRLLLLSPSTVVAVRRLAAYRGGLSLWGPLVGVLDAVVGWQEQLADIPDTELGSFFSHLSIGRNNAGFVGEQVAVLEMFVRLVEVELKKRRTGSDS